MGSAGRRGRRTLTGAVAVAALWLASSAPAALPPDLTDGFDSGDDGWSIYEGGSIGDAGWSASGGNPGGFLSYESPDAEAGDAAFGDSGYVAHLSDYYGRARIVADLRTTGDAASRATVRLVDPAYPALGSIRSTAHRSLSERWQHYSFPLDASGGWYDARGDRLDTGEFRRFLNLDPVILIEADHGGITGLDNVGLISEFKRSVSIRLKGKSKGFKGGIRVLEGFDAPQCLDEQVVKVLRKRKGKTRQFASATTDVDGRYEIERPVKPGRYIARAPLSEQTMGADCGAAKSKPLRVDR